MRDVRTIKIAVNPSIEELADDVLSGLPGRFVRGGFQGLKESHIQFVHVTQNDVPDGC